MENVEYPSTRAINWPRRAIANDFVLSLLLIDTASSDRSTDLLQWLQLAEHSTSVFERQQHARSVRLHLAVLDGHVRLYNLCYT